MICAVESHDSLFYDHTVNGRKTTSGVTINQSLSPAYTTPAGGNLELYRLIPPPADSPHGTAPSRRVVFTAELPSTDTDYIVVALPAADHAAGTLQSRVIREEPESHHAGVLRIINVSSYECAVSCDNQSSMVASGGTALMNTAEGRILIQIAAHKASRWVPAFAGERRLSPALRGYLFISDYFAGPTPASDLPPPPILAKTIFEIAPVLNQTADIK